MFQGQRQALAEAGTQAKADHGDPKPGSRRRCQQKPQEARQLDRQRQPQTRAPVGPTSQQQRQAKRTEHLKDGHQAHQVGTALSGAAVLDVVSRQPGHHAGVAAVDQAEVQGQQPRPAGAEPVPACGPGQLWRLLPWPQHGPGQHRQHGRDRPNAQARLPITEMAADVWTEYCRQAAAAHQRRRVQPHRPGQTAREPAVDQPRHHALHHRHAQAGDQRTGDQRPGTVQLQAPQAGQGNGGQAPKHAAVLADPASQPRLQQGHQAHAQHR